MRSDAEHADWAAASRSKAGAVPRHAAGPRLNFLMEAHNGLSARIAEEAGFEAIWASGLSIFDCAGSPRLQRGEAGRRCWRCWSS